MAYLLPKIKAFPDLFFAPAFMRSLFLGALDRHCTGQRLLLGGRGLQKVKTLIEGKLVSKLNYVSFEGMGRGNQRTR